MWHPSYRPPEFPRDRDCLCLLARLHHQIHANILTHLDQDTLCSTLRNPLASARIWNLPGVRALAMYCPASSVVKVRVQRHEPRRSRSAVAPRDSSAGLIEYAALYGPLTGL